jgi:hypothetical protein
VDVVEPDGTRVSAGEIEWDWIATYDDLDGRQFSRSYRSYYDPPDFSSFTIFNLPAGVYEITYHRVSVPDANDCSWYYSGNELRYGGLGYEECRLPNRNEQLLDAFELEDVQPVTMTIEITEDDLGGELETEILEIVDPVPGQ